MQILYARQAHFIVAAATRHTTEFVRTNATTFECLPFYQLIS
jgi:hypothetical protein